MIGLSDATLDRTAMSIVVLRWDPEVVQVLDEIGVNHLSVVDRRDAVRLLSDTAAWQKRPRFLTIADYGCVEDLLTAAASIKRHLDAVNAVISISEKTQYAMAVLNSAIGVAGVGVDKILASRDKRIMKYSYDPKVVAQAPHICVDARLMPPPSASEIIQTLGLPLIIKPVDAFSSLGVRKVTTEADLEQELRTITERGSVCLVESFLDGEEIHVEAIWHQGIVIALYIGKFVENMLSVAEGKCIHATSYLIPDENEDLYTSIERILKGIASALGMTSGVSHTEFFIKADGQVTLGETATRVGGMGINQCIEAMTGYSLKNLHTRAASDKLDGIPNWRRRPTSSAGYISLTPTASGRLIKMPDYDTIAAVPGVYSVHYMRKLGEHFVFTGSCSVCVTVITLTDGPTATAEAFRSLSDLSVFEIDDDPTIL